MYINNTNRINKMTINSTSVTTSSSTQHQYQNQRDHPMHACFRHGLGAMSLHILAAPEGHLLQ